MDEYQLCLNILFCFSPIISPHTDIPYLATLASSGLGIVTLEGSSGRVGDVDGRLDERVRDAGSGVLSLLAFSPLQTNT